MPPDRQRVPALVLDAEGLAVGADSLGKASGDVVDLIGLNAAHDQMSTGCGTRRQDVKDGQQAAGDHVAHHQVRSMRGRGFGERLTCGSDSLLDSVARCVFSQSLAGHGVDFNTPGVGRAEDHDEDNDERASMFEPSSSAAGRPAKTRRIASHARTCA